MDWRRGSVLLLLALASVLGTSAISRADVIGTCSCRSENCNDKWELRAASMTGLRAQCRAKSAGHGFLSRVHRAR
jgi:hypothetical protein